MTDVIQRQLGQIEGKQDAICKRLERIENKIDALPCETHTKDCIKLVEKRVPWNVFIISMSFLFALICGSFSYVHLIYKDTSAIAIEQAEFKQQSIIDRLEKELDHYGERSD